MSLKKQELQDLWSYLSRDLSESVKKQVLSVTGRGGQSASRDYISANCLLTEVFKVKGADFNLSSISSSDELWNILSPATRFRLHAFTPCLAARYDELKPAQQHELFNNPDWVCTEKQNGCRGWLISYKGNVYLYSRNYSDKDCGLLEYWSNIDQSVSDNSIYAIDVEIKFEPGTDISKDLARLGLETDSPLEAMVALLHTYPEEAVKIQRRYKEMFHKDLIVFRLIAPLYFKGVNYLKQGKTLGDGMDVYNECVDFGRSIGLNIKPIARCNGNASEKEVFLNTILDAGGEGVVFHYRKGEYCTSENRSKTSFIKLKRSVSSTTQKVGLGDQIDGFVTGFKMGSNGTSNEGLISALEFSIYVNDNGRCYRHVIAVAPNIPLEVKRSITLSDGSGAYPQEVKMSDGSVKTFSLNPDYDNLVFELDGQALSAVSQRLEHPRIIRPRTERSSESCIYTKEWLMSQTTNHKDGIKYLSQD